MQFFTTIELFSGDMTSCYWNAKRFSSRSSDTSIDRQKEATLVRGARMPILFSIYINNLPLNVLHGTCDMFADDTCIHVSDACYGNVLSKLQLSADEVCNWAANKFMTIHPKKTKYMIITTLQKHQRILLSNVSITINKQLIVCVSLIKFLGVIVSNNLSWPYHIKEIT